MPFFYYIYCGLSQREGTQSLYVEAVTYVPNDLRVA